jgi:hypothetical protein
MQIPHFETIYQFQELLWHAAMSLTFPIRTRKNRNSDISLENGHPDGGYGQFYQANGEINDSSF